MDAQEAWYAAEIPLRAQVIADVGANNGRLSQFFWDQGGGTSEVISIEPLSENVAAIRERIARCADVGERTGTSCWRVEEVAASDHDGELILEAMHTREAGWNSTVLRAGHEGSKTRRVPCRRLSQLVPQASVIKVDVEGHEYVLFEEALAALTRVHTWALELHSVPDRPLQETLAHFAEQGFKLIAAGRAAGAPSGPWRSVAIGADLSWEQVPIAQKLADGSSFRMLHVIARR